MLRAVLNRTHRGERQAVKNPRGKCPAGGRRVRRRFGGDYSFGFFTSTFGIFTSFFSVPTVGTVTVSFTVPVSTLGVFTVSDSVPTTGFWTSYCPSPVFLHAPTVVNAARATASASLFTSNLRERNQLKEPAVVLSAMAIIWKELRLPAVLRITP